MHYAIVITLKELHTSVKINIIDSLDDVSDKWNSHSLYTRITLCQMDMY